MEKNETTRIERLIHNLSLRKIEGFYCEDLKELESTLLKMIPVDVTVGIGNSQTLKRISLYEKLKSRGNIVLDKTQAATKAESKEISRKALLSDWYISGSNAISLEGHIVNVDHTGNRVAAMLYGPDKVVIVVGINKVEDTLADGISRAKNTASPLNAQRAGFNPPCVQLGSCIDCRSSQRVCNSLVVIEGQADEERMKVIIVGEELGF